MKSPLFSEGQGVSDSTAGNLSPCEAGAPLSHATQEPAVSIELSIAPDYLVCLEDGKKLKCLQKHLRTHGLTPDEYRAKWGLPATYPMVAPDYSIMNSELRKGVPRGMKFSRKRRRPQKAGV
jgi:predicted transcriptional regulator